MSDRGGPTGWSPWRTVVAFGLVSLAADMVYEGMRSVAGPFLGSLGAGALTIGIVTGAGEGIALVLRLATGPWADARQLHWRLTVVGYGLTAVCVPLLAVAPLLGAAGVAVAATLILLERAGKAVRSPSKSALLARMATRTGQGRGFGVHKALDQVGAFAGPLVVAAALALTGRYWPGFALLAVPGVVSLLLLAQLRRRVPSVAQPDPDARPPATVHRPVREALLGGGLPRSFHVFSLAAALATAGLATFGVISYRAVDAGVLPAGAVPVVYAGAMLVEALAALATGDAFDRWGSRTLLVVPVLVALVPATVFSPALGTVLLGVAVWGTATGVLESTVKAHVAHLVPVARRASAYGVFAALQGVGALAGGVLAGALAPDRPGLLTGVVALLQVVATVLLWRHRRPVESGAARTS